MIYRSLTLLVAILALLSFTALAGPVKVHDNQLIVKMKPGKGPSALAATGLKAVSHLRTMKLSYDTYEIVRAPGGEDPFEYARKLEATGLVEFAYPNVVKTVSTLQELEDGRVIAAYILPDGPADRAGMALGAEITRFDGQDIQDALEAVPPFEPQSTEWGRRHEQVVFLTRGPIGKTIEVEFINPVNPDADTDENMGWWQKFTDSIRGLFLPAAGEAVEKRMTSVYEVDSLLAVYMGGETDEYVLPSEYDLLPSGVGYIKLNSNYDDLSLLVRIFERALESFEEAGVPGIVVDLRLNYGGANMGLAGFLHDEEILMGQLEYYSDRTGQFEPEGPRDKVYPNENQYRFGSMVLLVDQFCYSACELEAYGFSQVPGMTVMGQFPTAGVEAETARGKFLLPAAMQVARDVESLVARVANHAVVHVAGETRRCMPVVTRVELLCTGAAMEDIARAIALPMKLSLTLIIIPPTQSAFVLLDTLTDTLYSGHTWNVGGSSETCFAEGSREPKGEYDG